MAGLEIVEAMGCYQRLMYKIWVEVDAIERRERG